MNCSSPYGIWYGICSLDQFYRLADIDNNCLNCNDKSFSNKFFVFNPFYDRCGVLQLYESTTNDYYVEFITNRWFYHCDNKHIETIKKKILEYVTSEVYFANIYSSLPYDRSKSVTKQIFCDYVYNIIEKRFDNLPNEIIVKIFEYV